MANIKDEFKKNVEEPLIKIFGAKYGMANRAKSLTESMYILFQTYTHSFNEFSVFSQSFCLISLSFLLSPSCNIFSFFQNFNDTNVISHSSTSHEYPRTRYHTFNPNFIDIFIIFTRWKIRMNNIMLCKISGFSMESSISMPFYRFR
jgi:hypothetical protein